jgi:hypothetical protein
VLDTDPAQVPCAAIVRGGFRDHQLEHGRVLAIVPPAVTEGIIQVRPPLRGSHQARLNEREPVKEPGDVGTTARDERGAPVQVLSHLEDSLGRLLVSLCSHLAQRQVAARHNGVPELPHHPPRVFLVPQAVQHADEHDPDRLPEVEQVTDLRVAQHLLRFAQISLERNDTGATHQRAGVARDHRVDVYIHHARLGRHPPDNLVGVGHIRQARAKVKELADALSEHVVHHPLQEVTGLNSSVAGRRYPQLPEQDVDRLGRLPVGLEVVLALQMIVPDAGRVGIADTERIVDLRFGGLWRQGGHRISSSSARRDKAFPMITNCP